MSGTPAFHHAATALSASADRRYSKGTAEQMEDGLTLYPDLEHLKPNTVVPGT